MKGSSVAACLLFCAMTWCPTYGEAGCVHYLTGVRGEVSSATDATSDYCEWVIRTDENRLILINFDVGEWRRGSHNCSATIMTFHDGSLANSNIIDTFCGDSEEAEPAIPDISTASTGNQLRLVINHGNLTQHRTEFELTFTTREIADQGWLKPLSHIPNLPRTPTDQGWLKPLSHIQNLPPNTSRPRLAEAPSLSHIQNLPPNTSRPRTFPRTPADQGWLKPLACHTFRTFPRTPADQGWLKPLSHIQNLPPNTSRPRLSEAPVTHSEPSPEHQPTKNLPPNTSRSRLAEARHTFRTFPRTPADQGWLKPVTHSEPSPEHQPTKNLPPNTSRPRLSEAPVTHSEPSPEHQPTKNLPPNTSRPRLSEAPVTHSVPSPEHQPTKYLPPNTSRPRLSEAPVTHSELSPEHQPTKNLPPNTSRPRLAEAPVTHSEPSPEHQPTKNLPPNTSRPRLAEAPVTHSEPSPEHQPTTPDLAADQLRILTMVEGSAFSSSETEPVFDERTFVPQTTREFNRFTATEFVQFKFGGVFQVTQEQSYPFGYKTYNKPLPGGSMLEFYLTIGYGRLDFELTPDTQLVCASIHGRALVSRILKEESKWPPDDDWPWIPFYYYNVAWERTEAVLKIIYYDVQVGEGNPNEVECVIKGQTFRIGATVTACPIGRFGRICMERCQCYNGASCHSFNGACKCAPGWTGRHCTIENPEVRISLPSSELTDLRYGQELQLTCTAYKFPLANITWFFENDVSKTEKPPEVKDRNSTHLNISSLLPQYEGHVTCEAVSTSGEKYNDAVDIRIAGCQDNLYGERCDQTCDCTGPAKCNRTLGCVCPEGVSGDGCPRPEDADTQFTLLVVSLTSSGGVILLVIVIILLHRQNNRLRVGPVNDPEIFKLGQKMQAVMPRERGPSSSSIDMDMLKEREIDRARLQIGQLLGEGAFGHVVKATLEQPEEGNVVVAVKKLKELWRGLERKEVINIYVELWRGIERREPSRGSNRPPAFGDPTRGRAGTSDNAETTARTDLLRETCIMLLCGDHDNVIGLKGICFRDGPLQLVLEYAEHGSLLHLLWTLRAESKLNRTVLVNKRHIFENMMVGVCCGLEHLASQRLVHRDIAARNILICGKGTAKIADFGLARDTYAVGYHRQERGNELLPLKWMAPEGLKNEAMFTHKSDVWSFGVLLWEVAQLGRTPYPGMDGADRIYDALRNHFRLPRPQLCTEERYQLMLKCWKFNEKRRPDATTVRKQLAADPNGFFYFNVPTAAIEAAAPVTPV
ncbi:hypothetical protein Bbelb_156740 [Branchiostoma belcheri]|nr:hypothetical protein Bbelb_156740 [Branchiostoma belcheri]